MSRRFKTRDSGGKANLTLLEVRPRSFGGDDIPIKKDFKAGLDLEGYDLGNTEEDYARKSPAPDSPTSPLTRAVSKNSNPRSSVAVVHRVHLQKFDEGTVPDDPAKRTITRRFSTGCVPSGSERIAIRRPSLEELGISEDHALEPPSSEPGTPTVVRRLSSQEVARKNKDAVSWFRQSRAINRKIRSIEDTETLLSEARERRAKGGDALVRRKSKEIPLGVPRKSEAEEPKKAEAPKKRIVDPAALWGAKPIKKKEEEPKPAREEPEKTCMRGNVQIGIQGENGLLARLRRRATVC